MCIVSSQTLRTLFLAWILPIAAGHVVAERVDLSWDKNPEPGVVAYRIHYGTAAAPDSDVIEVTTTLGTVSNLVTGVTYTFAVTDYNAAWVESAYSQPIVYTAGSTRVIPPAVLANISTRSFVQTGEDVMIGGFIIDGIVPKRVVLRGIGPSLTAAGVSGALTDPVLQVLNSGGSVVASNDDWKVSGEGVSAIGLAPSDEREAALVVSLPPGAYSAIVSGKGGSGGVALFELYDLDAGTGRVANISTRSRVEFGDNVMIGGFIVGGTTATKIIVRAIGPSLVAGGVVGALSDPTLELYNSNGALLVSNDNWQSTQEAEIVASTIPPTNPREAAIVSTLMPGAYSAVIRGANGCTGVALVEVYALAQ